MKRFALSALSVLLAAGAIAPMAHTTEVKGKQLVSIQQLRTLELNNRSKIPDIKGFSFQQHRLTEVDSRSQASPAKISLAGQRQHVLNRDGAK